MRTIETLGRTDSTFSDLSQDEKDWVYNGLDCCITFEVFKTLEPKISQVEYIYRLGRGLQGPAFTMMTRGVKIDQVARGKELHWLELEHQRLASLFDHLCLGVLDRAYLYSSPIQLKELFYDDLRIPEVKIYDRTTREYRVSTDRATLEKVSKEPRAKYFCELILSLRDLDKLLQVLRTGIDPDGRMRCGYQVAGPITGRWSSNVSAFGTGTNMQNLTDKIRRIFIPDAGKKFASIDLAGAESVAVGYITLPFGEEYLKACESGDIHTYVTKEVWPELFTSPGTNRSAKTIAKDEIFYKDMSYRDTSKRLGHGSNYYGTASVMAENTKIPLLLVESFQHKYFRKFPGLPKWHASVKIKLATTRKITTPFGRYCHFTGRPWDKDTINSAIAYEPQSFIGDNLNIGMYKVWKKFDKDWKKGTKSLPQIELLLQVHDCIVFQYDPADEATLLPLVQKTLEVPVMVNGRLCIIKSDIQTGWNWGKRREKRDAKTGELVEVENEFGLADFKGSDGRAGPSAPKSMLDRRLCEL